MSEILNVFIAAKLERWWTKSLVKTDFYSYCKCRDPAICDKLNNLRP